MVGFITLMTLSIINISSLSGVSPRAINLLFSTCKRIKKYTPIILQAARQHKIDPKLVHAVIQAESAYDAKAVSSAGAVGLMQLMPATARQYGATSRKDPKQNIFAGTRYLKHLLGLFDDNLELSLAAYNAGENAVKKYKIKFRLILRRRNTLSKY